MPSRGEGPEPSAPRGGPGDAVQARRRGSRRLRIAVALVGACVAAGLAATLISPGDPQLAPALVKVYNREVQCRRPRIRECRLGLARDPHTRYTPANVVSYVWHNDVLRAEKAWLPAVRLRAGIEPALPRCNGV